MMIVEHPVDDESMAETVERTAVAHISDSLFATLSYSARPNVLIVEENAEMREHFLHFLGDDYSLWMASSVQEALLIAREIPVDIIVHDIEHDKELEALNLHQLLRESTQDRHTDFISITGYLLPEGKTILNRARYDYRITKPFTLRRLRDTLALSTRQ